jgi:hypothetical protein
MWFGQMAAWRVPKMIRLCTELYRRPAARSAAVTLISYLIKIQHAPLPVSERTRQAEAAKK